MREYTIDLSTFTICCCTPFFVLDGHVELTTPQPVEAAAEVDWMVDEDCRAEQSGWLN